MIICNCLNPCCSGRWSRRRDSLVYWKRNQCVLILVVVEDGLGETEAKNKVYNPQAVLILVVVEDGLGDYENDAKKAVRQS